MMQTIIVPTDYSPASENAMFCAAQLAKSIGASVYLLHVYDLPVSMNDVPVLIIPADELRKNAEASMERTKELLLKNFPDTSVVTETRLGEFIYELDDVCKNQQPVCMVIAKHDTDGLDRFLFGNTVLSIIRNVTVPVITIPASTEQINIKNIAFATDGTLNKDQEQKVRTFIEIWKAQLQIIHVQTGNDRSVTESTRLLSELQPQFHLIKDEDLIHGIEDFITNNKTDLLVLMPHKHNFLERIFSKPHTAEAVEKLNIPVATINAG